MPLLRYQDAIFPIFGGFLRWSSKWGGPVSGKTRYNNSLLRYKSPVKIISRYRVFTVQPVTAPVSPPPGVRATQHLISLRLLLN